MCVEQILSNHGLGYPMWIWGPKVQKTWRKPGVCVYGISDTSEYNLLPTGEGFGTRGYAGS